MDYRIITNNPSVQEHLQEQCEITMLDCDYRGVLLVVRDLIHKGHILLTHPLSGSVKPNETPYKSVMVSRRATVLDPDSLRIIEDAIVVCDKFGNNIFVLTDALRRDFMVIDLSLISGAIPQ